MQHWKTVINICSRSSYFWTSPTTWLVCLMYCKQQFTVQLNWSDIPYFVTTSLFHCQWFPHRLSFNLPDVVIYRKNSEMSRTVQHQYLQYEQSTAPSRRETSCKQSSSDVKKCLVEICYWDICRSFLQISKYWATNINAWR